MNFIPHAYDEQSFLSDVPDRNEPFKLLNSLVVPRPIAFITTKNSKGVVNAAPFSYFNIISTEPPLISVSIGRRKGESKDTAQNIFALKEFVVNICSFDLAHAVTMAGRDFPNDVSEIDLIKLALLPSEKVRPPRIANTPIQMECLYTRKVELAEYDGDLIVGQVVCVHLHKKIIDESGQIDFSQLNPLARLSAKGYARVTDYFEVE